VPAELLPKYVDVMIKLSNPRSISRSIAPSGLLVDTYIAPPCQQQKQQTVAFNPHVCVPASMGAMGNRRLDKRAANHRKSGVVQRKFGASDGEDASTDVYAGSLQADKQRRVGN
jgi:hypothetical protein